MLDAYKNIDGNELTEEEVASVKDSIANHIGLLFAQPEILEVTHGIDYE